jgi:hypothetical protein
LKAVSWVELRVEYWAALTAVETADRSVGETAGSSVVDWAELSDCSKSDESSAAGMADRRAAWKVAQTAVRKAGW